MVTSLQLGQVDSLFSHIESDWCKDAYNEVYLWTNGDCIEVPDITVAECETLLRIPKLRDLLQNQNSPGSRPSVLDLCCGHGRHSLSLAGQFPAVRFQGLDQSSYLIDIARDRARAQGLHDNTEYKVGDARHIPSPDNSFDIVILMGNSLGHYSREDDQRVLEEVHRVLKPGGIFALDHVDGLSTRANFSQSGWEWVESGDVGQPPTIPKKKLICLRERELSPDQKALASREIVIDLDGPAVLQDLFYSVQLYNMDEMESILCQAGLSMKPEDGTEMGMPRGPGAADPGMMEHRQLVVAQKPRGLPTEILDPQDSDTYIHPYLVQSHGPCKGRHLRVSKAVPEGTVLLADAPYALVPAVSTTSHDALLCSNLLCRRRVSREGEHAGCHNDCIQEVIWCNDHCRTVDQARHAFECSWLKEHGTTLRHQEGEDDFAMLWLIVRMLAGRHLESLSSSQPRQRYAWDGTFKRGWGAIDDFYANRESWPKTRIQHWTYLIDRYLLPHRGFPSLEELLTLVCQEEGNSFGLYPGQTGTLPPNPATQRGPQYGLGCYARATMINHSCCPSVSLSELSFKVSPC